MKRILVVLMVTGCTIEAFTPPARPMAMSPAQIPATGKWDLQVDGNAGGAAMGPDILAGNVRYRHGVDEHVAVVGDVGFARVQHSGDANNLEPNAATGRAGAQISGALTDELDVAAVAGAGGGYAPSAGSWISGDVGGMVTGTNRYVRPIIAVDAFLSQPFATKVFTIEQMDLRLPRTIGVQGLAGFDLGPRDRAVVVGLAVAALHATANDVQDALSDWFIGLGAGFRFAN